ncbi:hypothetical protein [Pseudomonas sp. H3(2019)]|uniref:hypothetical protein n=1 Tax=Pseudomonas sp. H3(2019) TaxID=2598724 RepID=UPI0011952D42|nr:hypothetical protein [Pseudomonas sp. H3(2019)]TVT84316.1 hypothetical protein FPT12_09265 [Pseudomonas sp. H3(2019)]
MDRKIVSLTILLAALAGCSDPKKANEENFEKAAQTYLDTQYPQCFVVTEFPTETKDFDITGNNKALHALAQVGIIKEVELSRKEIPKSLWQEQRTDIRYSFDLTDEGRKFYKNNAQKLMNGTTAGGLCVGKAQIVSVDQFSEPGDMMGQKISRVTYSYKVHDLPDWAHNEAVVATIRGLAPVVASEKTPIKETRAMILTNNGWVHERLFGK